MTKKDVFSLYWPDESSDMNEVEVEQFPRKRKESSSSQVVLVSPGHNSMKNKWRPAADCKVVEASPDVSRWRGGNSVVALLENLAVVSKSVQKMLHSARTEEALAGELGCAFPG